MPEAQNTLFEQQILDEQPILVKRFYLPLGQNSKEFPTAIGEGNVAALGNADTQSRGIRKTRLGYTRIADDVGSTRVLGLGRFSIEGGTKYLTMASDTKWYGWTGSGNWTQITGAALTADLPANFVVAGNRQFLLNGTDNVFSTANGTSATDEGNGNTNFPKTRFAIYNQNRVLAAGNGTNTSYVWYSDALAPQTWDRAAKAFKVGDQDGDSVTALINFSQSTNPGFLAFKNRFTFFIDFDSGTPANSTIVPLDPSHGCCGARACDIIGSSAFNGDCAFLSKEGRRYRLRTIRRTLNDAFGTGGILSASIEDVLEGVNNTKMDAAIVKYFDERIFVAFPSGASTVNDTLAVLDLRNSDSNNSDWKWSVWTGMNIGCMATYEESSIEFLYFGEGTADTKVYRMLSGTSDNGTAITFNEESRREDFGYPELDKIFQFVEIEALATEDASQAMISAQVDGEGYSDLGMMNLFASGPHLPIALPFQLVAQNKIRKIFQLDNLGIGRDIQIKITHGAADKTINLLGYTMVAFLEPLHLETRSST